MEVKIDEVAAIKFWVFFFEAADNFILKVHQLSFRTTTRVGTHVGGFRKHIQAGEDSQAGFLVISADMA